MSDRQPFASVCLVTGVPPERSAKRVPILDRVGEALRADAGFPHELIVVDNGQTREHEEAVDRIVHELPAVTHLVRNRFNLLFGGGVRQAFALADGDFLVHINDDVLVRPGWLGVLLAPLIACQDEDLVAGAGRFDSNGKRLGTVMVGDRKYTYWTRCSGFLWGQRRETYVRHGPGRLSQRWDVYYGDALGRLGYRWIAPTRNETEKPFFMPLAPPRKLPMTSYAKFDARTATARYAAHVAGGKDPSAFRWQEESCRSSSSISTAR